MCLGVPLGCYQQFSAEIRGITFTAADQGLADRLIAATQALENAHASCSASHDGAPCSESDPSVRQFGTEWRSALRALAGRLGEPTLIGTG